MDDRILCIEPRLATNYLVTVALEKPPTGLA